MLDLMNDTELRVFSLAWCLFQAVLGDENLGFQAVLSNES